MQHRTPLLPFRCFFFLLTLLLGGITSGNVIIPIKSGEKGPVFPLVVNNAAAPIVLPRNPPKVIQIAAQDLANDITAITGTTPEILNTPPADSNTPHIELVIDSKLGNGWEAFSLVAKPSVLRISGSDRRGLAFGIYELSSRIGVSPWNWWADVPVKKSKEIKLTTGATPIEQPAVKYRGIFINDEDWGLYPWVAKTFEPEVNDIGPKTYSKVFELMLRLRANTIWPAMHECTKPFHQIPGNAQAADDYAIILGSSHAEPMLRNNVGEWKKPKNQYNYLTNREDILNYWEERIIERKSGESLFTLGMRGIHDSPIMGPKSQIERIATLTRIIADQRELLARHLGDGDPTRIGQIFCPYKEVLDDYNAGLPVPKDAILVWPDDNFGYIRHFPSEEERKHPGGHGVYYHASYLGAPLSWLWTDTMPPALIWAEMMRAYEHGAKNFWILNVGDLKNTERSTEFFLNLAWNSDRTDPQAAARFIKEIAARDFGAEHATVIADILARMQAINFSRKTEHLQWHIPLKPYYPTELNEAEIAQRLKDCAQLLEDTKKTGALLSAECQDAWFQLVEYPVIITAAANERYFRKELARADEAHGRSPEANLEAVKTAQQLITTATNHYQNEIAQGKWRHAVTENGVSRRSWLRFQPDAEIDYPTPTKETVCPPAPTQPSAKLPQPDGARPGDFIEHNGVISMHAGHFTSKKDANSDIGWQVVPGLGRSGSAVTVLPSNAQISAGQAPALAYRFHSITETAAKIKIRLLPTHPLITGNGLNLQVAIDDNPAQQLSLKHSFNTKEAAWSRRVLANAIEVECTLPEPLTPGWHNLILTAVDAGVVVDKIVIDLGGLQPSYEGPLETRIP